MCPLRFILVFFSALLAGYVAWRTVRSSSPDIEFTIPEDSMLETTNAPQKEKQEFDSLEVKFPCNFPKMIQNGFWVFVDMASGKYLWRNLKSLQNVDKSKSY
ncbi:PREDICTED: uncharacterized protein LOC109221416 [Nicotiana attenuata]|uniref:Methyltransferase-related protein n=1 Tax=Nicotiana attenuata TaxID=49451 RepID=A0A1J6JNR1_NICAT|nr:PREDICTED: uncharacterized protein LOC109221416 [Nicotiana attenuata]OIT19453.1 hypothetical protein A4A49_41206 [Nicotiana attenuata]